MHASALPVRFVHGFMATLSRRFPRVASSSGIRADIDVKQVAGKGRGVFALRAFRRGQLIERAPVIVMEEDPWELLNQTSLRDYYFAWGGDRIAVVLGFGSLYNHSALPNARAERRIGQDVVDFIAARDIRAGEEITFCYDCPPWFEVHDE